MAVNGIIANDDPREYRGIVFAIKLTISAK
jgi:hypothetical protein